MSNSDTIFNMAKSLEACVNWTQRAVTNYEIDKFLVGIHDTPQRQWLAAVKEFYNTVQLYKKLIIREQALNSQITMLQKGMEGKSPEVGAAAAMDISNYNIDLADNNVQKANTEATLLHLVGVINTLQAPNSGNPLTLEQVENAESTYWGRKLKRQAIENMANNGAGQSNIDYLISMNKALGADVDTVTDTNKILESIINNVLDTSEWTTPTPTG